MTPVSVPPSSSAGITATTERPRSAATEAGVDSVGGRPLDDPTIDQRRVHPLALVAGPTLLLGGASLLLSLRRGHLVRAPGQALTGAATLGGVGLATGVGLAITDAVTDKHVVSRTVDPMRPHEFLLVARNLDRPWLAPAGKRHKDDAADRSLERFGLQPDGPMDAFRHAYFSARMVQAGIYHGMPVEDARRLAREVGTAHEDRVTTDPANVRRQMDLQNNDAGIDLVGDGRDGDGDMLTAEEVAALVEAAMHDGKLVVADEDAVVPTLRPSGPADLPGGEIGA